MTKSVVIKIKGGSVSADFKGFHGKACEDLEKRIRPDGMEVESQELKPEHAFSNEQTVTESEKIDW